ncbi:hypothetical protein M231_08112 [Tremella mesenterica]|uniref:Uncharacterized protein n=1 Tax=Tremella mesenterica TaxID=5217 RepID=A0A4Q1B7T5_TREME|nr:hypothetical protein M231_08112 [Tremella mesenterica]
MDKEGLIPFGVVSFPWVLWVNVSTLNDVDFVNIPDVDTSLVLTNRACQYKTNCQEDREHRDFFMFGRDDKIMYRLIKVTEGEKSTFECQSLAPTGVTVTKNNGTREESQVEIFSEAFNDCLDNSPPPSCHGRRTTIS